MTTTITVRTRRSRIGRRTNSQPYAAEEKIGDQAALENAARFPLSLRTAAAGFSLKSDLSSSLLLEAVT